MYARATLGLDTFVQQKKQVLNQMANITEKFKEKMQTYTDDEHSKNMIFTEDLKNMIHIAESDEDLNLVVKMINKFVTINRAGSKIIQIFTF